MGRGPQTRSARTADPDEKTALWPKLLAVYSPFESYQEATDRDIPVGVLDVLGGRLRSENGRLRSATGAARGAPRIRPGTHLLGWHGA